MSLSWPYRSKSEKSILTPAGAIAKPTLPGAASETAFSAVPASTRRPTLATVTPALESDIFSAMPSASGVQKPSPVDPHTGKSLTTGAADDEQTDKQDSSPEHYATISIVNILPTENPEDTGNPPAENTVLGGPKGILESPKDQSESRATNAAPKPQTDAPSIFLEAQSSIDVSIRQQGTTEKAKCAFSPRPNWLHPIHFFGDVRDTATALRSEHHENHGCDNDH